MAGRLQKKWNVSGPRLILILCTFAIGGSLTGYLGRKILGLTTLSGFLYWIAYVCVITLIWPLMVLLVSLFTGQFTFFSKYLGRMATRIGFKSGSRETEHVVDEVIKSSLPRIAIFASGAGSNAEKIIGHFGDRRAAEVCLIVCNKPGAGVVEIASRHNIPVLLIEKERFFRGDAYLAELRASGADWLVLAGFLWKIPSALVHAFPRRIVNIHPALLPEFGGKGMYGSYVHQAVLEAGRSVSGITIHFVDEHYDNGDIIFQTACPVLPNDGPEDLANRIHALEHAHYPRVIEELVASTPARS